MLLVGCTEDQRANIEKREREARTELRLLYLKGTIPEDAEILRVVHSTNANASYMEYKHDGRCFVILRTDHNDPYALALSGIDCPTGR